MTILSFIIAFVAVVFRRRRNYALFGNDRPPELSERGQDLLGFSVGAVALCLGIWGLVSLLT
jgi:hypothetical protein